MPKQQNEIILYQPDDSLELEVRALKGSWGNWGRLQPKA